MRHASWLIISADAVIVLLHTTDQTTWEAKNKVKFKAFKNHNIKVGAPVFTNYINTSLKL